MKVQKNLNLMGLKVQDKITGMKGIVTSISFDLYGCVQAIVKPPADKNGKSVDAAWYDVSRLKIINKKPVMEVPDFDLSLEKGPECKPVY